MELDGYFNNLWIPLATFHYNLYEVEESTRNASRQQQANGLICGEKKEKSKMLKTQ